MSAEGGPAQPSKKQRSDLGDGAANKARRRRSVYVWDLDETLIVFNSLLDRSFEPVDDPSTGRMAQKGLPSKQTEFSLMAARERLARSWERVVLQVCDDYFFFSSVEECAEAAVADLAAFDDGADLDKHDFENDGIGQLTAGSPVYNRLLSYRLRRASERFALGAKGLLAGQPQTLAQWEVLWEETDAFTQGWLSAGLTAVTGERPPPPPPRAQTTAEPAEAEDGGVGAEAARVAPNAASTSGTADSAQDSAAAAAGASAKRRRRDSLDEEEGGWVLVEEEDGADGGCGGAAARSRPPPPEVVNVLVTAGCLLPTLAKLILFKLDKVFPLTHVLSARRDGKEKCFRRIFQQYGLEQSRKSHAAATAEAVPGRADDANTSEQPRSCGAGGSDGAATDLGEAAAEAVETRFLAIGDGLEEAAAATQLGWQCIRIAPVHSEGAVPIFTVSPEVLERKLWG